MLRPIILKYFGAARVKEIAFGSYFNNSKNIRIYIYNNSCTSVDNFSSVFRVRKQISGDFSYFPRAGYLCKENCNSPS